MIYADHTSYAVAHSLQTAFVASLVAERFGWTADERTVLVRSALTMNIAMLDLQNLLSQQTPIDTSAKGRHCLAPDTGPRNIGTGRVTNEDWLRNRSRTPRHT